MSNNQEELSQEEITKLLKNHKEKVERERPPTDEELDFIRQQFQNLIKQYKNNVHDWAFVKKEIYR